MTNNGTRRKTARQLMDSVSHPATSGPISAGMTHAAASTAKARGRAASSKARAMSTYTATMIEPVPRPSIERPAMRTGRPVASPAQTEPTRKMSAPAITGPRGPFASDHSPAATIANSDATV